jgi:iron complex outermembrane receptor protein
MPGLTPLNGLTTEDKLIFQNPDEMGNLSLEYTSVEWGFSGMIKFYYIGSRFMQNDVYNICEPLEPAQWGDLAFSQSFFDNNATVFFGIRNFSDHKYALLGYTRAPSTAQPFGDRTEDGWWPNEGRTYYGGLKTNLDFDRMRVPTTEDLRRMQTRLYGSLQSGLDSVYGWGERIRDAASFWRR